MLKAILVLSLLLLILPNSFGCSDGVEGSSEIYSFVRTRKVNSLGIMGPRKILVNLMDYDDAGPNTKHDPKKKPTPTPPPPPPPDRTP